MEKARKKELTRAYVERERQQGVFAVRCRPTGEAWIGSTRNLDTQQNGVWFSLRHGGHPSKALQAAWREHGEDAFEYEVVEALSEEGMTRLGFGDLLKERERHWRETMGAKALVG
jgi:hypothetical protein